MKLRVKGNSLMFRITRSEARILHETGRIGETTHFSIDPDSEVLYALEYTKDSDSVMLQHHTREILIQLPADKLEDWIRSDETLFYANIDLGAPGTIDIFIEKDRQLLDTGQWLGPEQRVD